MTLGQLRALIGDLPDEVTLLIAHQPHYPLVCGVSQAVEASADDERIAEIKDALSDPECLDDDEVIAARQELQDLEANRKVTYLYIAEGSIPYEMNPYLDGGVTNELGWGRGR